MSLAFYRRHWIGRPDWHEAVRLAEDLATRTGYRWRVRRIFLKGSPTWRVDLARPPRSVAKNKAKGVTGEYRCQISRANTHVEHGA